MKRIVTKIVRVVMAAASTISGAALLALSCSHAIGQSIPMSTFANASQTSPSGAGANVLLEVDQNRSTVIDRIVSQWAAALHSAGVELDADQFREILWGLRSDQLLAARLAGTLDGLRDVVANSLVASTAMKPGLLRTKALGDTADDLVYTPVTPCRLVETRGTFAAVYQGGGPFTGGEIRTYAIQGGNGVCLAQLPAGLNPSAVQLQVFGIPTKGSSGDIEILPQGSTFGSTSTEVYLANVAFTTVSTTAKINLTNNEISVQVRGGGANVAIDVVGYFKAPGGPIDQVPPSAGNNQTLRFDAVGSNSWVANSLLLAHQDGGVVMTGTLGSGVAPASGAGSRLVWYPGKAAFRAGFATNTQWDDGNIGVESIGLGYNTVASGANSTSLGGTSTANGAAATTIGWNNVASGSFSTAIGNSNIAAADNSIAMGQQAHTTGGQAGSFVYADSQNFPFASPASNEFAVRATGGVRFVTDLDVGGNPLRTVSIKQNGILDFGANTRQMINLWDSNYGIGVQASTTYFRSDSDFCWFMGGTHSDSECDSGSFGFTPMGLFPGPYQLPSAAMARLHVVGDIVADFAVYAQAFKSLSDRNAKTEIEPVEARAILSRVVELPISSWVFKTDPQTRHIGPMAQDFAAAFRIGTDDTHIAAVDAEGVAFAAIQGLHLLVQEKDAKIDELQNDLRAQRSELMRLQQAVDAFTARSAAVDAIDRGR